MFKKFLIILLVLLSIRVNAEEYNVFDMTIGFDDSWVIITRENIKDNETLKILGITEKEFEDYMLENDVYLSAVKLKKDNTFDDDIIICYSKMDDVKNLTNYDKKYIEGQAEIIALGIQEEGMKVIDKGAYENELYKYIYIHYKDSGLNVYFYQTAVNGNAYLVMYSTANEMNDKTTKNFRENVLDKITSMQHQLILLSWDIDHR